MKKIPILDVMAEVLQEDRKAPSNRPNASSDDSGGAIADFNLGHDINMYADSDKEEARHNMSKARKFIRKWADATSKGHHSLASAHLSALSDISSDLIKLRDKGKFN